jgi:hypothetical protein
MSAPKLTPTERKAADKVISALKRLPNEADRRRVLIAACILLDIPIVDCAGREAIDQLNERSLNALKNFTSALRKRNLL